jgi:hypothetical protein
MQKTSLFKVSIMLIIIALLGSACNMPRQSKTGTKTPNVTEAYQTVIARITEAAAQTPQPTSAPIQTAAPTNTAQPSNIPPTATSVPATTAAPTSSVKLCDQAEAGTPIDVTIPDDTVMQPGETFTKVWRLKNAGTCTWSKSYSIAVFSGEPMDAPSSVPLPKQIEPGGTVDISVDLVAPDSPGTYTGNWKLKNASGVWFGIGPSANSPFWIRIQVKEGTTTPGTPTSTEEGGNTATPTTPSNLAIKVKGQNSLGVNEGLDFDTNHKNGGGEDISISANDQGKLILTTNGSAVMAGFGGSPPTYAQCSSMGLAPASTGVKSLPQGLYICYRTDQGLYGWMRINGFNEITGILSIAINTWVLQ